MQKALRIIHRHSTRCNVVGLGSHSVTRTGTSSEQRAVTFLCHIVTFKGRELSSPNQDYCQGSRALSLAPCAGTPQGRGRPRTGKHELDEDGLAGRTSLTVEPPIFSHYVQRIATYTPFSSTACSHLRSFPNATPPPLLQYENPQHERVWSWCTIVPLRSGSALPRSSHYDTQNRSNQVTSTSD